MTPISNTNWNNALFVDTSGWAVFFDQTEPRNSSFAQAFTTKVGGNHKIVTTNYVLAELVALISSGRMRLSHARMVAIINGLKNDPAIVVEHITPEVDDEAWRLVVSRPDKQWSLVDAASFVVMRRLGVTEALTTDHHFAQASFVVVP